MSPALTHGVVGSGYVVELVSALLKRPCNAHEYSLTVMVGRFFRVHWAFQIGPDEGVRRGSGDPPSVGCGDSPLVAEGQDRFVLDGGAYASYEKLGFLLQGSADHIGEWHHHRRIRFAVVGALEEDVVGG